MSMKTILNNAMTLQQYVENQAVGRRQKEEISLTVLCNETVELDGFTRLKRNVERLNENIQKNSLQILNKDGEWIDVCTDEEMKNISVPLPAGLTNIQKLKNIEGFVIQAREQMGGLKFDIADKTIDYNSI